MRRMCGVAFEEVVAQVFAAEELQIHRKEGRVIDAVDVAKFVVELQAVEQRRFAANPENVVGEQIAVAVDDASFLDAAREKGFAARNEFGGKALDPRYGLARDSRYRRVARSG